MILARIGGKGYVNIASINGSENASRANRELGIIIQSNAGFEYYYKAFAYDWSVSGGTTYALSTSVSGNGSIFAMPASDKFLPNDKVTLTAVPDTGWHFVKWTIGGTDYTDNPITITMDSDKTVIADFEIDTFIINAKAGPGGTITPSGTVIVNYGADQTFTIIPDAGHVVADVKIDGTSIGAVYSYTFTNVMTNHTIEAIFAIEASPTQSSGDKGWTDITYAYSSDNLYAICKKVDEQAEYWGYGLSIGDATIIRVEVGLEAYAKGNDGLKLRVSWDGGKHWTKWTPTYYPPTGTDPNTVTWFDFTSVTTWDRTKLSDTNFRVQITYVKNSRGEEVYLDWIPVRVTYTTP
jgi:hypothetical protein